MYFVPGYCENKSKVKSRTVRHDYNEKNSKHIIAAYQSDFRLCIQTTGSIVSKLISSQFFVNGFDHTHTHISLPNFDRDQF